MISHISEFGTLFFFSNARLMNGHSTVSNALLMSALSAKDFDWYPPELKECTTSLIRIVLLAMHLPFTNSD
jgi:hypothetical protein